MSTVLLIPAAGSGTRLGHGVPKAFALLHGRTLLEWCLAGALDVPAIERIVVAVPAELVDEAARIASRVRAERGPAGGAIDVVAGGADRVASVRLALESLRETPRHVLVHDAARCLTPPEVFGRVIAALEAGAASVVPALPVTDTIKRAAARAEAPGGTEPLESTLDRTPLRRIQTPQGFDAATLRRAHARAAPGATDDAGMVEALGIATVAVPGDERALKITTPWDLALAEMLAGMEGDAR